MAQLDEVPVGGRIDELHRREVKDGLPKMHDMPMEMGGSGVAMPE
jgi:hypothetical protein